MCNCLTESKERVLEYMQNKYAGQLEIGSAECQNASMVIIEAKMVIRTYNDFSVEVTPIKKDGSLGKLRKQSMPMLHAYCPHCGLRYDQ